MTDTALVPVTDMRAMAEAIAKSGLFGIKTPDQALALMCVAQAEGRHPGIVARDYHIIQGRPTLKADAILARFQESGGKVEWHAYDHGSVEATFSHPAGGSLRIGWSMDDAKRAGLTNRDQWKQYPRAMLRARVISEGIRTVYPAVLAGVYTPEEVGDFDARPPRDMGEAERVDTASPEAQSQHPQKSDSDRGSPAPGNKTPANRKPITKAQHRRLEALLKEHGIPRERIKLWLSKRTPAVYPTPEDVHLDQITPALAEQIEKQIPKFQEVLAREAEREAAKSRPDEAVLAAALDAAVNEHGWHSDLADLPRVIEAMKDRAQNTYIASQARENGIDKEALAEAETLSAQAKALQAYLERSQEGAPA